MKVFLSATSLATSYGGPAHSVSRLAEALASEGIEVGLWAADGTAPNTPLVHDCAGLQRLGGTLEDALTAFGKPDLVHDNGLWLKHNHRVASVAASRKIPRTVSTRGMLEPWAMNHKHLKKRAAWFFYQRRDLKRATAIHATTEREANNIEQLGLGVPVRVIANGIDLPDLTVFPRVRDERRTALFLGRIYPVKGLPMLIDAWKSVRPPGWRLVIAGPDEADHLAHIQRLVNDAGLSDAVTFPGQVSGAQKSELFRNAELFVLPTHSESFGVAIAEALSFAVPVVTTTAAPWPHLEQRGCGWSAAPDKDAIANALREATSKSPGELAEMGRRGRDLVAENYSWGAIGPEFSGWLRTIATSHTPAAE